MAAAAAVVAAVVVVVVVVWGGQLCACACVYVPPIKKYLIGPTPQIPSRRGRGPRASFKRQLPVWGRPYSEGLFPE